MASVVTKATERLMMFFTAGHVSYMFALLRMSTGRKTAYSRVCAATWSGSGSGGHLAVVMVTVYQSYFLYVAVIVFVTVGSSL